MIFVTFLSQPGLKKNQTLCNPIPIYLEISPATLLNRDVSDCIIKLPLRKLLYVTSDYCLMKPSTDSTLTGHVSVGFQVASFLHMANNTKN